MNTPLKGAIVEEFVKNIFIMKTTSFMTNVTTSKELSYIFINCTLMILIGFL